MNSGARCRSAAAWNTAKGRALASVQRLIFAWFRFILLIFVVLAVRAQGPRLELSRTTEGPTVQLHLSGETNQAYVVEISTNLTSWKTLTHLQTTNGVASVRYDASQSHHSFVRARAEQTALSVIPQIAPPFGVSAFISTEGGKIEMVTPDLRPITLSIPAGCLMNPVEVRMSLVTNLVGLPFTNGTFGAVQIEPEGLVLLGAAELSIEYPSGLDSRTVVSFAARNDGTGFGFTVDRALSNRVVLPVADFALYGSAVASLAEVEALIPTSAQKSLRAAQWMATAQLTPVEFCRAFHPEAFEENQKQFPPSSRECFMFMVDRAVAVQQELRAFLTCDVMDDLAVLLAWSRQLQLLGQPDNSLTIISNAISRVCPIYEEKIEPLWGEANANCSLSIVLMQFMLGFERQVQILGLTNLANCNYSVFSNLDNLCKSAEGCLQQIQMCCDLGKKGQEKYLEIFQIIRQLELIGDTTCFPEGMDDSRVQQALDVCLTNAWYGSLKVRYYGGGSTNRSFFPGNETVNTLAIDHQFDGNVFASDEEPNQLPGRPRSFTMRIIGTGIAKEDSTLKQTMQSQCLNTNTSVVFTRDDTHITGSLTMTGDEDLAKTFILSVEISGDNRSYSLSGTVPGLIGKRSTQSFAVRTGCEGGTRIDPPRTSEIDATSFLPRFSVQNQPMGSDTNVLHGSQRVIGTTGGLGFPATADFTWTFTRVQQR